MAPKLTPILVEADKRRDVIRNKALEGIRDLFPIVGSRSVIDLEDPKIHATDFSSLDQKHAILEGRSLTESIKGNLVLKDKDGKVLDKTRAITLLNLPYFTDRHTFIVDGNEYSVANQVRLRPGVYTRRRGNQELESQFNLVKKGGNFSIIMEPETGRLLMKMGGSHVELYPVLRGLGVPHEAIASHWGPQLAEENQKAYAGSTEKAIEKLYKKIMPAYKQTETTHDGRIKTIKDWFNTAKMDKEVVKKNLGVEHESVQPETLLKASEKLIKVFNLADDTDDRDSLEFKRLHSVDDFIKEKILLSNRDLRRKISTKLDHAGPAPEIQKVLPSSMFTPYVKSFIMNSDVSATPTNYNPMEVVDVSQRITPLGTGGIGDIRAVPYEARQLHHSHFGILDPVRTSESEATGVDVRAAIHTVRDEEGNLYTPLYNPKTRDMEYVSAAKAANSVIAFPGENIHGGKKIDALVKGVLKSVDPKMVDYRMQHISTMYSPVTNLVPFLESMQGNRALMAAKMQTQALALKHKEAPLVQVASYRKGKTMEQEFAAHAVPVATVTGTVAKIDKDYVYMRPQVQKKHAGFVKEAKDADLVKIPYDTHYPLGTKSYSNTTLKVKEGDHLNEGDLLGDSNYTTDGVLSLGKNLRVALMAYKGLNSNDAIVISESAAQKLTSEHMYKETIDLDKSFLLGKEKHRAYFGSKYTAEQYNKLDEDGVVKKGSLVSPGDILFALMSKTVVSPEGVMLGRLHKSLVRPYRDNSHTFEHNFPGKVIDVVKTPTRWAVTVKTEEPMVVGDKLTGRHGNKGIVSSIVPDDQMVQDAHGRPVDVLYTSAGIVSRINPSQVLEMAVAKVAEKTGKPIAVPNFSGRNNVEWARKLLKDHGLTDKETVYDPASGKHIAGIMVGPQYMFKLMKTTSTNYSARGIGDYDINEQPTKGGVEGAKGLGRMEVAGFIAHNARNILKENSIIRSQRNDEFWRRTQLGLPPPPPKTTFAYDKFGKMLAGAGVKMDKSKNIITLGPLTDKHVAELSSGKIEKSLVVRAKDLRPEEGGLFDPVTTGGLNGTKWSHIELYEPVVNPVFEDPARHLLGLTGPEFKKAIADKGGGWVKNQLKQIDLKEKKKELQELVRTARGTKLDAAVKQLKYIQALEKEKLRPEEAFILSKFPVVPPVIRPLIPDQTGNLLVSDANYLYRDLILASDKLKDAKEVIGTPDHITKARAHLYEAAKAVVGKGDPVSPQNAARGVKGFLEWISGTNTPKAGYFQSKLIKRQLDLTGRSTIAPDVTLGMEEIGIPEDMLWTVFGPFVVGRLVRRGYQATMAKQMVEDRVPAAKEELLHEAKERPVIYNRAPSLHRYNLIAAYPKPIPGQTIRLPASWSEPMMNADFDGDTMQIHTPITRGAIEDAKKMTIPNLLFADKVKGKLFVAPQMEAIVGVYKASSGKMSSKKPRKFKTREEALAAYRRGEIGLSDPVVVEER